MPNYTKNYKLEKPLQTENYNVDVFNGNADIADSKIFEIANDLADHKTNSNSHTEGIAGNAATATKATGDKLGNDIVNTYMTKKDSFKYNGNFSILAKNRIWTCKEFASLTQGTYMSDNVLNTKTEFAVPTTQSDDGSKMFNLIVFSPDSESAKLTSRASALLLYRNGEKWIYNIHYDSDQAMKPEYWQQISTVDMLKNYAPAGFGLGSFGITFAESVDTKTFLLRSSTQSGFYASNTITDLPNNVGYTIIVDKASASFVTAMAVSVEGKNNLYFSRVSGGVWSGWLTFAPDGYGLGSTVVNVQVKFPTITKMVDLLTNSEMKNGFYQSDTTITDLPSNARYYLIVTKYQDSYVGVIAKNAFGTELFSGNVSNGVWSGWSGFAPSGFGLGSTVKWISDTDVLTLTKTGWYGGNSNITNAPAKSILIRVENWSTANDYITLIATDVTTGKMYKRSKLNNIWQDRWYQMALIDDILGSIAGDLSDNGWTKLPNGLILQWGKFGKILDGYDTFINFPISFNNCFNIQVLGDTITLEAQASHFAYGGITKTGFRLYYNSTVAVSSGGFWFALGK